MRLRNTFISSILALFVFLFQLSDLKAKEISLLAAISLKEVVDEMVVQFQKEHPGNKVVCNYAASGILRTQIENGAPADLFIPASLVDYEILKKLDRVQTGSMKNFATFATNELVLIASPKSGLRLNSINDLEKNEVKKIALGNIATVPAGKYAKQVLDFFKMEKLLASKGVYGENVRQVLDYVLRGEVEAGFVYKTDILKNKIVALTLPKESYQKIIYPIFILKSMKNPELIQQFFDFATSSKGKEILVKYGFSKD